MASSFKIKNLTTTFDKKKILTSASFTAQQGDIIAILGPNGAGKSTLLKAIMHHFQVQIESGQIIFNKQDITNWSTDKIAKLGVFYATQNPTELDGVQLLEFFKVISNENSPEKIGFYQLYAKITDLLKSLGLPNEILTRNVNVGFSGGQKKKNEILQSELFNPKLILLDEIDSGLDFDAIKLIAHFITRNAKKRITIIVTHHLEFLQQIKPNRVIVLINGKIVKIGDITLATEIEKNGYKQYIKGVSKHQEFDIVDPYLSCHKQ
ncbi:MAG: Fe-S cluster assembly ATPase SufC [Mycoplasmataceae bacterium]|nr:Fe-S cluster assembly ATPase SufC [Mycoplasmataceae bacterium]